MPGALASWSRNHQAADCLINLVRPPVELPKSCRLSATSAAITCLETPAIPKARPTPSTRCKLLLARSHSVEAIERAAELMRNSKSEAIQLAAISMILDRAFGGPKQEISVENQGDDLAMADQSAIDGARTFRVRS
jgi:hypothetical protein